MTGFLWTHVSQRSGQEKLGNLGMSFPGNMTCSQEIFRRNTINLCNF